MYVDGKMVVRPSKWDRNKEGETLVVEADLNTGMVTYTDKKTGQCVGSVEYKSICTGTWRFFVTLQYAGTTIRLVPTQAEDDREKSRLKSVIHIYSLCKRVRIEFNTCVINAT